MFALSGVGLFAGTWLMRETSASIRPRVDVAGATVLTVSLAALMLAVSQGPSLGWIDPLVLSAFAVGVIGVVALIPVERRAPSPLLDPALLRNRRFMGWTLAAATTSIGYGGVLAFLPSYLQSPAGYSAGLTGLIVLLPTIPMVLFCLRWPHV